MQTAVTAGRLPHCDGPQVPPDDVKMLSSGGLNSTSSSQLRGEPVPCAPRPERYRRAAQLLQGAFETAEVSPGDAPLIRTGLPLTAPQPAPTAPYQPLIRTSSACSAQHQIPRRIVSMEAMPSKEPMTEDGSTALSDTQTRSTMSTTTLTPRVEPGPGISNLRMRWSFSDTKVVPSVPMQPGISPQNRVSSWAPPGAQAWRSPRHSYTPSACSTPQAPVTPMKPVHEMRPTGTATPPLPPPSFPQFAAQSTSYAPPLAAFPRQPGVRSTVGVASHFPNTAKPSMPFVQNVQTPPVTSPSSRVESQVPTQPTQPGRPPVPPLGGCLDGSLEARQSLGRRMWRSGTHGKAIGPPMHHEKDDNLTSVCVKLQHKLGKLSTKKTISL